MLQKSNKEALITNEVINELISISHRQREGLPRENGIRERGQPLFFNFCPCVIQTMFEAT